MNDVASAYPERIRMFLTLSSTISGEDEAYFRFPVFENETYFYPDEEQLRLAVDHGLDIIIRLEEWDSDYSLLALSHVIGEITALGIFSRGPAVSGLELLNHANKLETLSINVDAKVILEHEEELALHRLPALERYSGSDRTPLRSVFRNPNLRRLTVVDDDHTNPFQVSAPITSLELEGYANDRQPLPSIPLLNKPEALEEFSVREVKSFDVASIAQCVNMRSFYSMFIPHLDHVETLSQLPKLQSIHISEIKTVSHSWESFLDSYPQHATLWGNAKFMPVDFRLKAIERGWIVPNVTKKELANFTQGLAEPATDELGNPSWYPFQLALIEDDEKFYSVTCDHFSILDEIVEAAGFPDQAVVDGYFVEAVCEHAIAKQNTQFRTAIIADSESSLVSFQTGSKLRAKKLVQLLAETFNDRTLLREIVAGMYT